MLHIKQKTYGLLEARNNLGNLVRSTRNKKTTYIIQDRGVDAAVLISVKLALKKGIVSAERQSEEQEEMEKWWKRHKKNVKRISKQIEGPIDIQEIMDEQRERL